MTLDENLETKLKVYDNWNNEVRKVFLKDPSTDNFEIRGAISDPRGEAMYSQPAGIVYHQLEDNIGELFGEISSKLDAPTYGAVKNKYALSDEGKDAWYVQLARLGLLPKDASDDLKGVAQLAKMAYDIEERAFREKYDELENVVESVTGEGSRKSLLASQYNLIGQGRNTAALALRIANMQKRIAQSKLTTDMKAAIDKVIDESNANRAKAAAEMYRVYNLGEDYQAKEGKKK